MSEFIYPDNVRELSTSTGTGNFTTTGGSVVVPTAAIGRSISSVANISDVFDYVIHSTDLNEWEVGVGTYQGINTFSRDRVVASSAGTSKVSFTAGNKAVWIGPTSENIQSFMNAINIKSFGATAGGSNATAITAARTLAGANRPIVAPNGATSIWGIKQGTTGDFGGDTKGEGSLFSGSQGTAAIPSTASSPLIYLEKYTTGGATNDHGVFDARVKKIGGNQYTYSIYASAENAGGGAGRVAPIAALLNCTNTDALNDVAGVFYAQKTVTTLNGVLTGVHISLADTSGQDNGWQSTYIVGSNIGMSVENAVGRGTYGIRVGNPGTPGAGFYTGFLIDTDSILPDSYSTHSEGIRINGASAAPGKFTGMQFGTGYMAQAINLVGPTYDSSIMIVAPKGQYISFGSAAAATRMRWTIGDIFSLYSGTFGVEGTQVLGARVTGWTTPAGTPTRTGFTTSTATATDVAEALCALITDLKTHGMIGT